MTTRDVLAIVTIVLLLTAAVTALWAARGAERLAVQFRRGKALFALMFAGAQLADFWWWTPTEWITIARTIQVGALLIVWILPDLVAMASRKRIVAKIEALAPSGEAGP